MEHIVKYLFLKVASEYKWKKYILGYEPIQHIGLSFKGKKKKYVFYTI
jgi:hypothetical protein